MENKPENFFKTACYFEGSLIFVAIFLGWIADINPFENLYFSEKAIIYGCFGTLPLFLVFLAMEQMSFPSVKKIKKILLESFCSSMHQYHWADFFVLAVIAGFSEEVLFRGVLQPWMENSLGMNAGLIGSSLIFGLVHAVTPLYAVVATAVSIYLGLFLDYGGERNLLTPIIIHSLYDFLAFITLLRTYRATLKSNEDNAPDV